MKKLSLLLLSLILFSCQAPQTNHSQEPSNPLPSFDWLVGSWLRTNDSEGKQTYELWNKANDTLYLGLGYTLKGSDTTFKENIALAKRADNWAFEVGGLGDTSITAFVLSSIDKNSFVCENAENEFPKKIHYIFQGDSIHAVISGDGNEVAFNFVRDTKD